MFGRTVRLAIAALVLAAAPAWAANIRYRLDFDATWSEQTHPIEFAAEAHFSPPAGALHDDDAVFWTPGELASPGIKDLAELGDWAVFFTEIDAEIALGHANPNKILVPGIDSPGFLSLQFVATEQFPRLTLLTMVACSPDWFIGTRGLPLRTSDGRWRDNLTLTMFTHDAGTDSGLLHESPDEITTPPEPVSLISEGPMSQGPAGTFSLTITLVDNRLPYEDEDGDGLTNLREAEIGTDPTDPDTDGDTIGDAIDNCPLDGNMPQTDTDLDGVGDTCDNCDLVVNPGQHDFDTDGEGDLCDLNDGKLLFTEMSPTLQDWQDETTYATFNLYRGDLAVLRGGGPYTQAPGGAAARFCGLVASSETDAYAPLPGEAVFYLVAGDTGDLGQDSSGATRPDDNPCPP